MSRLLPPKPTTITLDTLPELFAHHRARFGGMTMEGGAGGGGGGGGNDDPPERPEDFEQEAWDALGDPGKRAIVRERERNADLQRQLTAARARPAPPGNGGPKNDDKRNQEPGNTGGALTREDVAQLISDGIKAGLKPFHDREQERDDAEAAAAVIGAVRAAAEAAFRDPLDAVNAIALDSVVTEDGKPDADKIKTQVDKLLTEKPYLAKDHGRIAPPGLGAGAPSNASRADRVVAAAERMRKANGLRTATDASSS